MKKIIVEISAIGETKIDAQGFTGNSCTLATKELELVLAGAPSEVSDKKKPDFYATTGNSNTLKS